MPEKQLPNSQEAEEGLLGSIILDPEAIDDVSTIVKTTDFFGFGRRLIYQAIMDLHSRHEPADFITLSDVLKNQQVSDERTHARDRLDEIGGSDYLLSLVAHVPTSGNAEYYARIVARKAELRRIIHAAGQIAAIAYAEEEDALAQAEKKILAIGQDRTQSDLDSLQEYLPEYLTLLEQRGQGQGGVRGVSTGIRPLDGFTGGLQRGKLYVPAARPGDGKTTLCQNIAYKAALKYGCKVGYLSLEMSREDVLDCLMSMHTKTVNSLNLQNGQLDKDQWEAVVRASDEMESLGIYIAHTPGIYLDDLASIARRSVQKHGIDLFVVDYMQLIRARIDGKRIAAREMEVAEIARGLKALAGELGVPFLVPAQLNRQVEHAAATKDERMGLSFKMPTLADLRESGEIEQSGDVVMFLARALEDSTIVRLQIAKNRRGPKGAVDLKFEGETTRFIPLARIDSIAAD